MFELWFKSYELFHQQVAEGSMTNFKFYQLVVNVAGQEKYFTLLCNLVDEFKQSFSDFKSHFKEVILISDPFRYSSDGIDTIYQLELIEVQNNSDLRMFAENDIILNALLFISLFGSTYCCEQLFSRMKNIKTKARSSLLRDGHISSILRISTSTLQADIDHLYQQNQCQVSH